MTVPVLAPNEHGEVPTRDDLTHMGRDVVDCKPDAAFVRAVRRRGVQQAAVVKGCLPGRELHVHHVVLVDRHRCLLAAVEEVFLRERVGVLDDAALVRPGHETHTAVGPGRRAERHPGAHHVVAVEAPVTQILVPADVSRAVRLFDEQGRSPDHDVRSDNGFDHVEHAIVSRDCIGKAENDMGIVELAVGAEGDSPSLPNPGFQLIAVTGDLIGAERVYRKVVPVLGVSLRYLLGSTCIHRPPPVDESL